jgi:hypothetical protein
VGRLVVERDVDVEVLQDALVDWVQDPTNSSARCCGGRFAMTFTGCDIEHGVEVRVAVAVLEPIG